MSAPRASSTSSGGVRNLRAMFENKDDASGTSPPDRGRSPAGSLGTGRESAGTSPRPLSKVRTSFVAVERSGGQMGLVRTNSEENGTARRSAFSLDEKANPAEAAERKNSIQAEFNARKNSTVIEETIPEVAVETPASVGVLRPGFSERTSYMNGKKGEKDLVPTTSNPTGNPDKIVSGIEDKGAKLLPGDPKSSAAVSGGSALSNKGGFGETLNGNTDGKAKTAPATKAISSKPTPISTKSSTSKPASKPTKSPATIKPPTTPKTAAASHKSTTPAKLAEAKVSKPVSKPARTSTSSIGPPPKKTTTTPQAKTRSPTRPVKLPASLTAPTASSLQKTDPASSGPRHSLAPSSGNHATGNKTASRSPSRVSATSTLSKKRSNIGAGASKDRPALGRPSLGKSKDASPPKKELKEADEGFLARMMRPTTASKSKVNDKVDVKAATPPRKVAPSEKKERPATQDGSVKSLDSKSNMGSPSAKKPVPAAPKAEVPEDEAARAEVEQLEGQKVLELKEEAPPATPAKAAEQAIEKESDPKEDEKAEEVSAPTEPATQVEPEAVKDDKSGAKEVPQVEASENTVEEPLVLTDDTEAANLGEQSVEKSNEKLEVKAPVAEEPAITEPEEKASEAELPEKQQKIDPPEPAEESSSTTEETPAPITEKLEALKLGEDKAPGTAEDKTSAATKVEEEEEEL